MKRRFGLGNPQNTQEHAAMVAGKLAEMNRVNQLKNRTVSMTETQQILAAHMKDPHRLMRGV